jgi:hypothetical protein
MLFSLLYLFCGAISGEGVAETTKGTSSCSPPRHPVRFLQRQSKRPRFRRADRVFFATASRALPRRLWSCFPARTETLLPWHRELVRRKRTYRSRRKPGRPSVDLEIRGPDPPAGERESFRASMKGEGD